jgi:DNA-binding ferritin-like protein (Dps family)
MMDFWEKITGNAMKNDWKAVVLRTKKLPVDYQAAWESITTNLWMRSDFTGRNVMPIFEGVLVLLEESAADGLSIQEVLGNDIEGFCSTLAGDAEAKSYRDKWREQLNSNVARKLGK